MRADGRRMTFHVTNNDLSPELVTVGYTNGPTEIRMTENYQHLRSFWSQLGDALDEAEHRVGTKLTAKVEEKPAPAHHEPPHKH